MIDTAKGVEITPESAWKEYTQGRTYNDNIKLYDTVKQNEDFYIGKQWEGVNAPDLEKPVINFIKRNVNYQVSQIVSDDIGVSFTAQSEIEGIEIISNILEDEVKKVIEDTSLSAKGRRHIRNCAVDGDSALYCYYDPDYENGQLVKGRICTGLIDNTNIIFGNPYVNDVQAQPYIIIVKRSMLKTVQREAQEHGLNEDQLGQIKPDSETNYYGEDKGASGDLVTVLIRFEKRTESVEETAPDGTKISRSKTNIYVSKSTQTVILEQPKPTGYELYPVAYMSWDEIKNSYHGQAIVTGMIPNQIYVNKMWAMIMHHQKTMAFPKVFYDGQKIKDWDNRVGAAIDTMGPVTDAIATTFKPSDMSNQAVPVVEKTLTMSRDMMGASDAALGNVKPNNTSAIIAVQKATAAPLELQRLAYFEFMEEIIRVIVDMIRVHYGLRTVAYEDSTTKEKTRIDIDFGAIDYKQLQLRVDVGAAAYWSELMQIQTIDNLFNKKIISDPIMYLESIPDAYVHNKGKIINELRQKQTEMAQMQQLMGGGMPNAMPAMQAGPANY